MDALEETGTKDEPLLAFNADHGGTGHGGVTDPEYDIQIALGGQTLTGDTNRDIPVLVLAALRGEIPASMDGAADLFTQANLDQEELVNKDRAVETVTATADTNVSALELTLSDLQEGNVIKTLDTVIDLKGHWAEEDVLEAVDQGLFQRTSSTTFAPDQTLTRGMMVTVLYRLAGEPIVAQGSPFTDVAEGAYYADAVAWAAEESIVLGVSETLFCPNQPITRQQLAAGQATRAQAAVMLLRLTDSMGA